MNVLRGKQHNNSVRREDLMLALTAGLMKDPVKQHMKNFVIAVAAEKDLVGKSSPPPLPIK